MSFTAVKSFETQPEQMGDWTDAKVVQFVKDAETKVQELQPALAKAVFTTSVGGEVTSDLLSTLCLYFSARAASIAGNYVLLHRKAEGMVRASYLRGLFQGYLWGVACSGAVAWALTMMRDG